MFLFQLVWLCLVQVLGLLLAQFSIMVLSAVSRGRVPMRRVRPCDVCARVTCAPVRRVCQCDVCSRVTCVPVQRVCPCNVCAHATCVPVRCVCPCDVCTCATCVPRRRELEVHSPGPCCHPQWFRVGPAGTACCHVCVGTRDGETLQDL